jgi:hypothetical protein
MPVLDWGWAFTFFLGGLAMGFGLAWLRCEISKRKG